MGFAVAAALATAVNVSAGESTANNPYFVVLTTPTATELATKSADLVLKVDSKQRQQTTIDVVKAAVPLNPAAAPAIVGSIARSVPEMAAIAAATAVSLAPDEAAAIAHAAAVAAPSKAGKIVESMCHALPAAYQQIADAVADVVPGAGREILTAVSTAVPTLKDSLNKVLASYGGNVPSVSTVLNQVQSTVPLASAAQSPPSSLDSPALAAPTVGTPYVPTPVVHTTKNPRLDGGVVPPGNRNYASP
jgi:hypothetical protein